MNASRKTRSGSLRSVTFTHDRVTCFHVFSEWNVNLELFNYIAIALFMLGFLGPPTGAMVAFFAACKSREAPSRKPISFVKSIATGTLIGVVFLALCWLLGSMLVVVV